MQDYISFAAKNGIELQDVGPCQFCGAMTQRGVHECLEIFNLGFQNLDFSDPKNHSYRFLIVDAHTLQHPEIHGRWNNHFHLTRLRLVFYNKVEWTYELSPKLSDYLNKYKQYHKNEVLIPPPVLSRGKITTTDVLKHATSADQAKKWIFDWATSVYTSWEEHHETVGSIANGFLSKLKQ